MSVINHEGQKLILMTQQGKVVIYQINLEKKYKDPVQK